MHLCNTPEDFVREARYLLIYDAKNFSFNENFRGIEQPSSQELLKIDIPAPTLQRQISLKEKDQNDFFDIKLQFSFFDLDFKYRNILYSFHKRRKYTIVLFSNTEMMILGNDREPMSISIQDHISDNTLGKDAFQITITGQSIIFPKQTKIKERFRVLFFGARAV